MIDWEVVCQMDSGMDSGTDGRKQETMAKLFDTSTTYY